MTDSIRVLYVDDEPYLLELGMKSLMESGDFSITTVESASEALDLLQREPFDVIVSDYQMPVMDGIHLLTEVRKRYGAVPFILFTGRGREEVIIEAINSGVDLYLQKGGDNSAQFAELSHEIKQAVSRKKAADALVASEEKYRTIFENTGTATVVLEENGIISFANNGFVYLSGYSKDDIEGKKNWTEFVVREEMERMLAQHRLRRQNREGALTRYEFQFSTKSGAVRTISLSIDIIPGTKKSIASLLDITERKRAEAALKESEQKYRDIFENSVTGLFKTTPGGLIINANDALAHIYGYTCAAEILQAGVNSWQVYANPEDRKEMLRILAKNGVIENYETYHVKRDGTCFPVSITARTIRDDDGTVLFYEGTNLDITELKRVEEALRESERCIRKKLESLLSPEGDIGCMDLADIIDISEVQSMMDDFFSLTNIGIAILDLHGKVLVATGWQDICTKFHRVNPRTCANCVESDNLLSEGVVPGTFRIYRCKNNMWDIVTPITVGGNHVGNLFLGQFLFEDESVDYELFRSQAVRYGFDENSYLAALDRVPRWSRETIDKVMTFYSRFARMISTLSHSNIRLARTVTELDTALTSLGRVNEKLNVISHLTRKDLTRQIFVLMSYLELAKSQAAGQEQIIQSIQESEKTARSIKEIVELANDYQDMGANLPQWQDVQMVLLLGLSHIPISEIQHSLETEHLEIFADPLLEKAFQGLFENSRAHGGHVTSARVWYTTSSGGAVIIFEDNGAGVPQEKKETIFQYGENVRAAVRGLFFVREILDITGITIRETGEPGKGARFEIMVPDGAWRFTGVQQNP